MPAWNCIIIIPFISTFTVIKSRLLDGNNYSVHFPILSMLNPSLRARSCINQSYYYKPEVIWSSISKEVSYWCMTIVFRLPIYYCVSAKISENINYYWLQKVRPSSHYNLLKYLKPLKNNKLKSYKRNVVWSQTALFWVNRRNQKHRIVMDFRVSQWLLYYWLSFSVFALAS